MLFVQTISCIFRKKKQQHLINATTWWKPLDVIYPQHKSVSKGEGVRFFQNYFVRNIFFAIDNQENTIICLLQPEVLGRNDLCMNNRCIIFIRFIMINNTARHLCEYLYLKHTMQNSLKRYK